MRTLQTPQSLVARQRLCACAVQCSAVQCRALPLLLLLPPPPLLLPPLLLPLSLLGQARGCCKGACIPADEVCK